jgi:hypothetical protein
MHQDIETCDLIGQWLPLKRDEGKIDHSGTDHLWESLTKNLLLHVMPYCEIR